MRKALLAVAAAGSMATAPAHAARYLEFSFQSYTSVTYPDPTCEGPAGSCEDTTREFSESPFIEFDTLTGEFSGGGVVEGGSLDYFAYNTDFFQLNFNPTYSALVRFDPVNYSSSSFTFHVTPTESYFENTFIYYRANSMSAPGQGITDLVIRGSDHPITFGMPLAPVPEPAAWAMMLVGFGAIGGAMRGAARAACGRIGHPTLTCAGD